MHAGQDVRRVEARALPLWNPYYHICTIKTSADPQRRQLQPIASLTIT